jgi:hypothetical protein
MLDETIITEVPPLYACYGRIGRQVRVPITGQHARRILHGAINVWSGDVALMVSHEWNQDTHQMFLGVVRSHWRGWHIVLFEDRASQHRAARSLGLADQLDIEVRLLPRATPELNAMDHLWRDVKKHALSNRPDQSIDEAARRACWDVMNLSPHERLRKAGVLSGSFWLARECW